MHLVIDISGHGYGHLSQIAALLPELRRQIGGLRLTVRSTLAPTVIRRFLGSFPALATPPAEPVPAMRAPDEVDGPASLALYRAFLDDWPKVESCEAKELLALGAERMLSNAGVAGLLAARAAGIPAFGLCSLNWADILQTVAPEAAREVAVLRDAYVQAQAFIVPEPGLPMDWLGDRRRGLGPLCQRGRRDPGRLRAELGWPEERRIVLVSWGGIAGGGDFSWLPRRDDVGWLVAGPVCRADMADGRALALPFADLLASADLVVAKPGYGMFCEAAATGTPLVWTARPDWPETEHLERWLQQNGSGFRLPRAGLGPHLDRRLDEALALPRGAGAIGNGAAEAVRIISGN